MPVSTVRERLQTLDYGRGVETPRLTAPTLDEPGVYVPPSQIELSKIGRLNLLLRQSDMPLHLRHNRSLQRPWAQAGARNVRNVTVVNRSDVVKRHADAIARAGSPPALSSGRPAHRQV